ncbi:MAG: SAM-dependent methyltransferase [Rhodobacteraceae bacterium PARR1]|nr:MAG: SAM-dependent methyltransferase [Rhodobacteraceae bacterium PARR1]
MDIQAVRRSYARWAPIYDMSFGWVTGRGRRRAVSVLNALGGRVLEVGVGTGLSLPQYGAGVEVTGIDASAQMLEKAQEKVTELGLSHVKALRVMDARALDFPDGSFDHIAAMHIMSVVPEPERVMDEMARVLRPGGTVLIISHFARDPDQKGWLPWFERTLAPMADLLGWHSDFERARVVGTPGLTVIEETTFPPLGIMTLLRLRKD